MEDAIKVSFRAKKKRKPSKTVCFETIFCLPLRHGNQAREFDQEIELLGLETVLYGRSVNAGQGVQIYEEGLDAPRLDDSTCPSSSLSPYTRLVHIGFPPGRLSALRLGEV